MVKSILIKIGHFYVEGFRTLTPTSKRLWLIIFIKLFIMFAILKLFFFPNFLKTNFSNDSDRANYVIESITQ